MTAYETARRAVVAADVATEAAYLALMSMGAQPSADVRAALEADYIAACNAAKAANAAWMAAQV